MGMRKPFPLLLFLPLPFVLWQNEERSGAGEGADLNGVLIDNRNPGTQVKKRKGKERKRKRKGGNREGKKDNNIEDKVGERERGGGNI